jgi:hypothetical protein
MTADTELRAAAVLSGADNGMCAVKRDRRASWVRGVQENTMNAHRSYGIALVGFLALGLGTSASHAQDKKPPRPKGDVNNLMKELMSLKLEDDAQSFALWMPFESFVEIAIQPDGTNRDAVEEEIDYLKKYQVMVIGSYLDEKDGTRVYATQKELERLATLKLATGEEFPLAPTVPPKVVALSEQFKRTFSANQGEFGMNMHVLIFSAVAKDGKTVLTANRRNTLILSFREGGRFQAARHEWRTPFDALEPTPPCARCDQPLSAKWSFCPWCGAKIGPR